MNTTTTNNDCMPLLSCDKLDRMANWVGANVASAFFASLERCSCIHLNTIDFDDDIDTDSSKDQLPLLLSATSTDQPPPPIQPTTATLHLPP